MQAFVYRTFTKRICKYKCFSSLPECIPDTILVLDSNKDRYFWTDGAARSTPNLLSIAVANVIVALW